MKSINTWSAAILVAAMIAMAIPAVRAADAVPQQETPEQRDARMKWWREARFGMFIHWGLYAVPAGEYNGKKIGSIGEWIMNNAQIPIKDYEKFRDQFNPVKFDAKQWVKIAGDAGMKYLVITSKHHDGFCLWDSAVSDWDIMSSPFKRDILKELADACKADGRVRLCFYHSVMDWHHPDAQANNEPKYNPHKEYKKNPNFDRYIEQYMKPQLKELVTRYDPAVLWFDGEWVPEYTEAMGHDVYKFLKQLKPDIIINNRVGKSRKGMAGMSQSKESAGDFGTPEQEIPATGIPGADWESCMTMNDTWGFKKDDNKWKSSKTLIQNLVDIVSKGGNYLLNVGPTAEGEIPAASVERLADMAKWMSVNGQSIHGAQASPFKKPAWGRATTKGNTVYVHVFAWPANGQLDVPLTNKVTKAYLLSEPAKAIEATTGANAVQLKGLPATAPDAIDTVIVLELDGAPKAGRTGVSGE